MGLAIYVFACIIGSAIMIYVNDHMKDGNDLES